MPISLPYSTTTTTTPAGGRARRTVFGLFSRTARDDVEAQSLSTPETVSTMVPLPPVSIPAPTFSQPSSSRTRPMYTDAIDDFFGATPMSRSDSRTGTRVSRHDNPADTGAQSATSDDSSSEGDRHSTKPPSYNYAVLASPTYQTITPQLSVLPPYAQATSESQLPLSKKSPPTLAMYLFKYGFICPLFWVFGSFLLLWPLSPPESYLPMADPSARSLFARRIRNAEIKWATRCLIALTALLILVLLAVVLALAVTKLT